MTSSEDIRALQARIAQLERDNRDLEIALSTAIEHGDMMQSELEQANQQLQEEVRERTELESKLRLLVKSITEKSRDLELTLQAITEHSDQIDLQWFNRYRETENAANTDPLTGLNNRRVLDQAIQREWDRAKAGCQPLTLILCDIDYFKSYNDNYGHQKGDHCLSKVAEVLSQSVHRTGDIVARYGGEEFVILLPNTTVENALAIGERIQARLDSLNIAHAYSACSDRVTLSMGISTIVPKGDDKKILFAEADRLLYEAKNCGRNRIASQTME